MIIREEVERNVRWSAGLAPGGIGGSGNGRPEAPGSTELGDDAGDDIEIEREDGKEEPWWKQTIPQTADREN
jgi:hypothetical protein